MGYSGGLAERSKAADLKSVEGQPSGGSNPSPSARDIALSLYAYFKTKATLQF